MIQWVYLGSMLGYNKWLLKIKNAPSYYCSRFKKQQLQP